MSEFEMEKSEKRICETTGKRCYNSREAGNILNSLKHHRKSDHLGRNKDLPRRKYYCSDCGCYHLTKKPFYSREERHHAWESKFYREYKYSKRTVGIKNAVLA